MANWSNPQLTSTYTNFVTEVKDRDVDLAKQFDGQTVSNLVTGAIRWDSSANRWKKWTGSAWGELTTTYALTGLSTTSTSAFGGNVTISGSLDATSTISGTSFAPDGSTAPANGVYLPAANTLGFATDSGGRVFISSTGALGVGDQTPGAKLDVVGGIKAKGGSTFNGDMGFTFNSNDTDGGMFSTTDNEICFATNNTRRVTFKAEKVGIGEANPSTDLHIRRTDAEPTKIRLENTEGFAFFHADGDKAHYGADGHVFTNQAGQEKFRLDTASTQLMIGATSASHNLHVQGTAKVTGALTVDGGITSSITGNSDTASDLAINATNRIVVQASNNTTEVLPAGTSGQLLKSNGTSAVPSWVDVGGTVPIGGIIIWSGAQNAIPSGWALCDGNSGRPDLRSRFVIGAGGNYSVNSTGGSEDAVNVSHTHTTASAGSHGHGVNDPGHNHNYSLRNLTSVHSYGDSNQTRVNNTTHNANTGSSSTGITIQSGGAHTHNVNSSGVSGTGKNMPPYFALCYIQRIS